MSYADALREEERYKEIVYSSFESEIDDLVRTEKRAKDYYTSGSFDDSDAFMAAGPMYAASRARQAKQEQVKALYNKPYFAHLRLLFGNGEIIDCFLSDNENLDSSISVGDNSRIMLIPFKQDSNRQLFTAAFHCYQEKTSEKFSYLVTDRYKNEVISNSVLPKLIRDIDIHQRQINDIVTFLPQDTEEAEIEADELLAKRLKENRNNAKLRNIIATLQLNQFDIIRTDIDTSFIVQGCAGSGKTQCLIHRLFFLRDTLRDGGWNKVLLITPTQLFRNYSSELIHRYHLETIEDVSLAAFYKQLLESFDQRFTSRQYKFELTEEYLPDTYLRQVYAPEQIKKIDAEIEAALNDYIADGCRLTGVEVPVDGGLNINFINALAAKLSTLISAFDETEKSLSEDLEYQTHRKELDSLEMQLSTYKKKLDLYSSTRAKLFSERELFENLSSAYETAQSDIDSEKKESISQAADLLSKMSHCVREIDRCNNPSEFSMLISTYADLRSIVLDKLELRSDDAKFGAEYRSLLINICEENKTVLLKFTKNKSPREWISGNKKATETNDARIKDVTEDIELTSLLIEDQYSWLREHNLEVAKNQRKAHRAELERARYFLSRIESSVFEQEVWNALAPLKTECKIETINVEELANGRQKQSKVLYKSDLLFYLKIYCKLHKDYTIPSYNLICIDEGQDLHSADYEMITALYPKAALNVFGDTEQVLHESCGIRNWRVETGIDKLFEMSSNYRNTAAIADFCNKNFGSNMKYYGAVSHAEAPRMLSSASEVERSLDHGTVVVVKNKNTFEEFCSLIKSDACKKKLAYIDTSVEKVPDGIIPCYSIFAAKGLEFRSAIVYLKEMTKNQKVVACTRAMEELFFIE
jgi:Superfamily I DNA and RNA helicases